MADCMDRVDVLLCSGSRFTIRNWTRPLSGYYSLWSNSFIILDYAIFLIAEILCFCPKAVCENISSPTDTKYRVWKRSVI